MYIYIFSTCLMMCFFLMFLRAPWSRQLITSFRTPSPPFSPEPDLQTAKTFMEFVQAVVFGLPSKFRSQDPEQTLATKMPTVSIFLRQIHHGETRVSIDLWQENAMLKFQSDQPIYIYTVYAFAQ